MSAAIAPGGGAGAALVDRVAAAAEALVSPRPEWYAPPGAGFALSAGGSTAIACAGSAILGTSSADDPTAAPVAEVPEAPDTLHDLASVSKMLTTMAVLRLVDSGTLSPETTLADVFGSRAGAHSTVTMRQLLEHRAGLREWWPLHLDPRSAADGPLATVLGLDPAHPVDESRNYSDLGFQLLGAVVSERCGVPFAEAIDELVLTPLSLASVRPGPRLPAELLPRAAADGEGDALEREMVATGVPYPVPFEVGGFDGWRSGAVRGETGDGTAFHAFGGPAGHAGWFGTVGDLLSLALAFADPGSHGLFGAATRDRFLQPSVDPGQALGLRRYPAGALRPGTTLWGHPGFTGCAIAFAPVGGRFPVAAGEGGSSHPFAAAMVTNRLHGAPAPARDRLAPTESLLGIALDGAAADHSPPSSRPDRSAS